MKPSFGIYLHIPFCRSRCDYCGFLSCCDLSLAEAYFDRLCREISESPFEGRCGTLYVGGGTPSAVPPALLARAAEAVSKKFPVESGAECTVECNPDSFDDEEAFALRDMGFNRVSLGVQSFSDDLLRRVGRRHDGAQAAAAAERAKRLFSNVSADLMLGLPGQGLPEARGDLEILRRLELPHVSVYGLKVEPGTPLEARGYAPDEDESAGLYDAVRAGLAELGLERYEVSNFARPGFESRHNLKYWRREDYLGFGAGAHACVGNRRFWNGNLAEYLEDRGGGGENLTEAEVEYETIILALRTREGLDRPAFEARFNCDFEKKYASAIRACGSFLEVSSERVRVADAGFYVLNALLVNF